MGDGKAGILCVHVCSAGAKELCISVGRFISPLVWDPNMLVGLWKTAAVESAVPGVLHTRFFR